MATDVISLPKAFDGTIMKALLQVNRPDGRVQPDARADEHGGTRSVRTVVGDTVILLTTPLHPC